MTEGETNEHSTPWARQFLMTQKDLEKHDLSEGWYSVIKGDYSRLCTVATIRRSFVLADPQFCGVQFGFNGNGARDNDKGKRRRLRLATWAHVC